MCLIVTLPFFRALFRPAKPPVNYCKTLYATAEALRLAYDFDVRLLSNLRYDITAAAKKKARRIFKNRAKNL